MQDRLCWGTLGGAAIVALCGLLAACGVTSPGGLAASTTPGASSTAVTGTPGTIHPVASCTTIGSPACVPSPTATSSATAPPGAVRLVLDKTSYAPGSVATVSVENGLSTKIEVVDHRSSCTFLLLEQLLGEWQPVEPCRLMTPTRLIELPAGSVTLVKLGIPNGPNAAGTYRVALPFVPGGPIYSATFTVG